MPRGLNPFEAPPRVFISYARSDGEEIAKALRARLTQEHAEITLWMDRSQMVGGIGWWKQITEALDRVEILLMILSPGAMKSEVAAKEWRYARQQGVRVCPVMPEVSGLDFQSLPRWMRKAHCYDLSREWETFVSYLQSSGKENRVPFMAPDLPDRFVPRSAEFNALLNQLLDQSGGGAVGLTTALHGAGGFGKTTLACMLCHDERVISAFDDGILWVSLGETPNVQGELTKLYASLTGERPPFVDSDDASIQLADRLDQKNSLLIIDDVWDPNHLKPFLRGGGQCARVVTTRQLSVLTELSIPRTLVDRMTADESLQLLTAKLPSSSASLEALRSLADRLGHWPLLLKLAGSQLRERIERGDSLEGALAYLDRAMDKRGPVAFDRAGSCTRNDAVARTVAASLELFSSAEQKRCAELAIFRGDTAFPLGAAATLWDLDSFETENLMLRLADAALLDFDLKTARVRLHKVLRAYFETRIDTPQSLHGQLAGRWLQDPRKLPDAYAWTWIGWHLAQAHQLDRLRELLLDFDWLRARLSATPPQITLQDFALIDDGHELQVVRDCLRLAVDGLTFDPGQLRAQLHGRIIRGRSGLIDRLLDQADRSEARPRLTLADTSLTHPGGALTGILKSHLNAVEALAISPTGRSILSGSQDWTVRLWDLETNSVLRTFEGHTGAVYAVAFAQDGQTILSGSEDRSVRLWDLATGQVRLLFRGHTLAVRGVAIASDGKLAYSASEDGTVREWNLATRQSRTLFKGRSHQLGPLVLTPDGRRLIFSAGDWTIGIMDLTADLAVKILEGHSGIVRSLAVAPEGPLLLSGADDGVIRVWSLDSGQTLLELRGHAESVEAVALAADGKRAISGSRDRTLRVWNLETGQALQVLEGHSGFVRAVAFSAPSRRVISASTDRTIRHWNIESGAPDQSADGHNDAVSRLAISADGTRAISASADFDLLIWNAPGPNAAQLPSTENECATTPKVIGRLQGHRDRIHAVQLTADGKVAVTGSRDRTVRVWDVGQRLATYTLKGHTREILDLQISADGRRAVSLSPDRSVRVWDLTSGRAVRILVSAEHERTLVPPAPGSAMIAELEPGPAMDVSSKPIPRDPKVALSPDGNYVVLGSPGNVSVWNLLTGATCDQELNDLDVVVIEFGPSSERVVIGSLFGPLLLWQFERPPLLLEGHSGRILDVVVTPDGHRAVSAATDDTIRLWDLDAGRQLRQIRGYVGRADAVAIAPDGTFAYSIHGHTLAAYDLSSCRRLGTLSFDHQITTIAVTPTGTRLAIGDLSGRVHFLSLQI